MVMPADPLLTVAKAAEVLGVHGDTLRDWDNAGVLPSIRTPGGHRRFRLSDLEALKGNFPAGSQEE